MYRIITLTMLMFLTMPAISQTATNFNCSDCNAVNHDLFSELESGKVVVITWVMPCGTCIAPAATASAIVESYANPDIVFYLSDDYADNTCLTLTNWASANAITTDAVFSNANVDMSDYGVAGMPKTVVIGGPDHTVFFNVNGTISQPDLEAAIDEALAASVGIAQIKDYDFQLRAFPNPSSDFVQLHFTLQYAVTVQIEVINMLGETIYLIQPGNLTAGIMIRKLL
ncbi:MAG: hypothetical protein IPM77_03915 [Crocinitomicaceae bacterium]|nr:hypothetical protein [Crocinitomicaceae bacterium]